MKGTLLNSIALLPFLLLLGCTSSKSGTASKPKLKDHNTFVVTELSADKTYGYTEGNPVKVGGVEKSEGPLNERRFLNALAGPNGERITYSRLGSCCHFKTKNGIMGGGLLDKYQVQWEGLAEPVLIYINMYDYGPLKVPAGFTAK